MTREKGTASFSANFEAQKAAPIDARMIVNTKNDLIVTQTQEANDGYVYTYRGMIVSVHSDPDSNNNGLYRLKDENFLNIDNQEKLGMGSTPLDSTIYYTDEINFHLQTNNTTQRYMHYIPRIPSNLQGYISTTDKILTRYILKTVNYNTGKLYMIKEGTGIILEIELNNSKYATGFPNIAIDKNDVIICYIESVDGFDKPVLTLQLKGLIV